jgi:hypothetical protein
MFPSSGEEGKTLCCVPWVQWLSLALSEKPKRESCSLPSSEDGKRCNFRNEFRTMNKVQKPTNCVRILQFLPTSSTLPVFHFTTFNRPSNDWRKCLHIRSSEASKYCITEAMKWRTADDSGTCVPVPIADKCSPLNVVQNDSGVHPASYPMGIPESLSPDIERPSN